MRRKRAFKRGRLIPVLLAGVAGYLIGAWHVAPSPSAFSATDSVAQRFPREADTVSPVFSATDAPSAATALAAAGAARKAQLALFNPEPMVATTSPRVSPAPDTAETRPASPQNAISAPLPGEPAATSAPATGAVPAAGPVSAAKPAVAVHHAASARPGYMLNDAQIASIKQRLNLTPEQQQMWPAVETALRRMAYAHVQAEHRRSLSEGGNQAAAVDPNSVEGLKSAAVPLIMSFNDEQKQEVRNLVHVMGLDQLASQF